jgi:hypothetical protein
MVDRIIEERSNGNETIALTTKAKITLKGVSVDKYTDASEDDPKVLANLRKIAGEMGVIV